MAEWWSAWGAWWQLMTIELHIFYLIAVTSTLILLMQTFLMLIFGGDGDIGGGDVPDTDGVGDTAHGGDIHLLSVRSVTAFLMGFGWTGVICLKRDLPLETAILYALGVGALFMAGIYYMMRTLYNLRDSGNIDYHNAVGQIGTVYVPIPPAQSAAGQIEVMIQGRVRFVDAFTNHPEKIKSTTRVKVLAVIDSGTVLVEPLHAPDPDSQEG
ncbi:MAG: hypothetical protein ACE15F_20970 [bacterium]